MQRPLERLRAEHANRQCRLPCDQSLQVCKPEWRHAPHRILARSRGVRVGLSQPGEHLVVVFHRVRERLHLLAHAHPARARPRRASRHGARGLRSTRAPCRSRADTARAGLRHTHVLSSTCLACAWLARRSSVARLAIAASRSESSCLSWYTWRSASRPARRGLLRAGVGVTVYGAVCELHAVQSRRGSGPMRTFVSYQTLGLRV